MLKPILLIVAGMAIVFLISFKSAVPKDSFLDSFNSLQEGEEIPKNFISEFIDSTIINKDFYGKYVLLQKEPFESKSFPHMIYELHNGVCKLEFLITYNSSGKIIDQLKLSSGCDHDGANPIAKSISSKLNLPKNRIIITYTEESVSKDLIDENGLIKDGKSFWDLETETKTTKKNYLLQSNGKIKEL